MYGEDQLWCLQAQQLGYPSYYYAGTTVIHIHAASTAPAKQLQLLKKFLALELDIMAIQKGKTLYYYLFSAILTFKEMMRYYIKVFALKVLGRNIR
jgi:GT2 family glycosyltransferase